MSKCPECKTEISGKLNTCPECGYPIANEITSKAKHQDTETIGTVSKRKSSKTLKVILIISLIINAITITITYNSKSFFDSVLESMQKHYNRTKTFGVFLEDGLAANMVCTKGTDVFFTVKDVDLTGIFTSLNTVKVRVVSDKTDKLLY